MSRAQSRSRARRSISAAFAEPMRSGRRRITSCPGTPPGASHSCLAVTAVRACLQRSFGGIVNPPGGKGAYWTRAVMRRPPPPSSGCNASAPRGSWWPDWAAWLSARSGPKGAPPRIGSSKHPPLEDAPGPGCWSKNSLGPVELPRGSAETGRPPFWLRRVPVKFMGAIVIGLPEGDRWARGNLALAAGPRLLCVE